jgi:tRNA(fMet)-specific endonuclease VapC
MKYLLDTNVCIVYLKGRSESVNQRFQELLPEEIAVCSIVRGELLYGGKRSNNPEKTLQKQRAFLSEFVSLPFDDAAAEIYSDIRARLSALGTPIGSNDLQIAAIALANNLTLVTHNIREFERVEGLRLEDWELDEESVL